MSRPSMPQGVPCSIDLSALLLGTPIRRGLTLIALFAACLAWAQHSHAADKSSTTPSKAKPTPPLHASSRVIALRKALAACEHKGNYFSREACKDKARWKYCGAPFSRDPLWGKVPECPNSTPQNATP